MSDQKILPDDLEDPNLYTKQGKLYQGSGNFGAAIACYENAIRINSNDVDAHYELGHLYRSVGEYQQSIFFYSNVTRIDPNQIEVHNELGKLYQELGNLEQAINCYRNAIQINSRYMKAHYNLGHLYQSIGQQEKAINSYQVTLDLCDDALALEPNNEEVYRLRQSAAHLLNSQVGVTTKTAPPHYVQGLFDEYANRFDYHLVEILDYKVPQSLKEALASQLGHNLTFDVGIDLGCGTGLSGQVFRPICKQLVGIDLSPKMIEIAKGKNIYDTVENNEISIYLEQSSEKYDLFIATDLLIYIGDLTMLFSNISKASNQKGIFVFSTELVQEVDYSLTTQGRYAHSESYIRNLAQQNKFNILNISNTTIRTGIEGQLFVIQLEY